MTSSKDSPGSVVPAATRLHNGHLSLHNVGIVHVQQMVLHQAHPSFNPVIATLKQQSNGPSYSNTVIGTLAVDGWAATFGTARRRLGGAVARPGPSSLYQM